MYLRGDPRNWWVWVVDAHRSESAKECSSERDLWWPHCLDTTMISVKDFESTRIRINDSIIVELGEIDSRRESRTTRRGVWVLIDDYLTSYLQHDARSPAVALGKAPKGTRNYILFFIFKKPKVHKLIKVHERRNFRFSHQII